MNCRNCSGGIVDTGNNCLPCEQCPAGATAIFSDGLSGWQTLLQYNPPGCYRRPAAWAGIPMPAVAPAQEMDHK